MCFQSVRSLGSKTIQFVPSDDRLLDHVEESPDVEIAPLACSVGVCARTPDTNSRARKEAQAVHADVVEHALLVARQPVGEVERAVDGLVRGALGRRGWRRFEPRSRPCGPTAAR
jgi:hypothetical protein